jgi:hypothetical protein
LGFWVLGQNPKPPIPNPQSPIPIIIDKININIIKLKVLKELFIIKIIILLKKINYSFYLNASI